MQNDNLVLINGESGTGKSASLMNLVDHEGVMYLNCEAGKKLPFKNKFDSYTITDPYQVYEAFTHSKGNPKYHTVVVDTLTFLMDMFESIHVIGSNNTQQAWGDYQQFFKNLMQQYVASSDKNVIFLAHTKAEYDEKLMGYRISVPVKGALKNNGVEAFEESALAA